MRLRSLLSIVSILLGSLIGCGTYESTIHTRSERELANMHNALIDRKVRVYYRDSTTGLVTNETARDLLVDVRTATWKSKDGELRAVPSNQLVKVRCYDCKDQAASGAAIGALSGGLTGAVAGAMVNLSERGLWNWSNEPQPTSKVPVSILIGTLVGGSLGALIGTSSPNDGVWLFESSQAHGSPSSPRSACVTCH